MGSIQSNDTERLVNQAASGNAEAMAVLLERYRDRLKVMVKLHMDRRLQGRIDASDVVQEALIEAAKRVKEYAAEQSMGFYVWLRWLAGDRLLNVHRQHLGTQKRDVSQEVSLYRRPMPEANSISLAQQLLGQMTSPTRAVMRAELQLIVQQVLNSIDPMDREILVLRNFEQLSTPETAEALGIKRSTAGKRYIAALKRLQQALAAIPELRHYLQ